MELTPGRNQPTRLQNKLRDMRSIKTTRNQSQALDFMLKYADKKFDANSLNKSLNELVEVSPRDCRIVFRELSKNGRKIPWYDVQRFLKYKATKKSVETIRKSIAKQLKKR